MAQQQADEPENNNSTDVPSVRPPSPSPSLSPSDSNTVLDICVNTPGWKIDFMMPLDQQSDSPGSTKPDTIPDTNPYYYYCDDDEVSCDMMGSLGFAEDHCCKCKPEACCDNCNVPCTDTAAPVASPESTPRPTWVYANPEGEGRIRKQKGAKFGALIFIVFFVVIILCCNREERALRNTRRTLRRRRGGGEQGDQEDAQNGKVTAERYQQFLSNFEIHTVSMEKKNISENSSVSSQVSSCSSSLRDVENGGGSAKSSSTKGVVEGYFSARDECCICLDGYHAGDSICLAVNTDCSHVFHEECALEWLKSHSQCPLCRIDLMK